MSKLEIIQPESLIEPISSSDEGFSDDPQNIEENKEDGEILASHLEQEWLDNDQIEKTAEGDLVLNGFITVFKEKLGSGAFCTVKKAIGTYKADGEDIPEDIVVPYAVKIYEKSHLKGISHRQGTGLNLMSNLEAA